MSIKSKIIFILTILLLSISYPVYAQVIDNNHRFQKFSWAYNPDISRNERLEDLGNVYKDRLTGLKWEKNPSTSTFDWENAKSHCTSKGAGWRLPTIYELRTLISLNTKNSNGFYSFHPGIIRNLHWTSTTYNHRHSEGYRPEAWFINFGVGSIYAIEISYSRWTICILN